MALGIQGGGAGGDVKPFIKFDARAGRMFRVDRNQDASGAWATTPVDITNAAQFVIDLANIEVGYIHYTEQGPIRAMVTLGGAMPEKPAGTDKNGKPAFKQAFNVRIALPTSLNGGVAEAREFNSSAGCVIEAMDELHNAYVAAPESKAGKLPVVQITGSLPVKSAQSTNYKPIFNITGWVDRPASLAINGNGAARAAPTIQAAAPPATGSTQVSAPAAAPAPQQQLASVSAGDFG